jgi:hypothetical protein
MPLGSRGQPLSRGGVQIVVLYRLHPWVSGPEAIIHAECGQTFSMRKAADQRHSDEYQGA